MFILLGCKHLLVLSFFFILIYFFNYFTLSFNSFCIYHSIRSDYTFIPMPIWELNHSLNNSHVEWNVVLNSHSYDDSSSPIIIMVLADWWRPTRNGMNSIVDLCYGLYYIFDQSMVMFFFSNAKIYMDNWNSFYFVSNRCIVRWNKGHEEGCRRRRRCWWWWWWCWCRPPWFNEKVQGRRVRLRLLHDQLGPPPALLCAQILRPKVRLICVYVCCFSICFLLDSYVWFLSSF